MRSHVNSLFNSISYRLGALLVDPGDEWEGFKGVEAVLLSHAHFDHIYGLNRVVEMNPDVRIYTNEYGKSALIDAKKNMSRYHDSPFTLAYPNNVVNVTDGQEIALSDGLRAKAIFTPGHNPSCITWQVGDFLFTGDAYIPGIKTVTNLPDGNRRQADASEQTILALAQGHALYPGHHLI